MDKKPKYTLEFEKPLEALENQLTQILESSEASEINLSKEVETIQKKIEKLKQEIYANLTPWQKIQLARHPERPYALDYIEMIFDEFQELHGDRCFKDDGATVGGTAMLDGQPVIVIGQQKGRTTKEKLKRNFGSPNPEGYRKALRLMQMAERFKLPIISLIDTPGAYPGIGAEERHVAEAIAVNIREMSTLKTPIIGAIIGEGGSGGALGVGVVDSMSILENAYYSVISPEGCAAILWKDRKYAPEAAEALKLSANHLLQMGIVDKAISEPTGGAHRNPEEAAQNLKQTLKEELKKYLQYDTEKLLEHRYAKYRAMGVFGE